MQKSSMNQREREREKVKSETYLKNAKLIQHTKINKCNTPTDRIKKTHNHPYLCRKSISQNSNPFMIKTLSKLGIKVKFLNLINGIYETPANVLTSAVHTLRKTS